MTDPANDDDDYDLKDEELVDFEGSDYGFESGEDEDDELEPTTNPPSSITITTKGGFGSVEIENEKDAAQVDGVLVQPPVVDHQPRDKLLPPKPDLEDGELDDAAMVITPLSSPWCPSLLSVLPPPVSGPVPIPTLG